MSNSIYNLFMVRRMTERWLRLSQMEQGDLFARINDALEVAGGRRVITCDASWCNEAFRGWGVEEFPDFASWRQYAAQREKLEWYSYFESWSMLGTWHGAVKQEDAVPPEPGKIYQLFLIQGATEAMEQLSQEERDALWAKEGQSRQDSRWIVIADGYWASEEYQGFGVVMYPDIEYEQRHFASLMSINWPRYFRARTLLGTLWEE